jgi:CRP/FNR family cyclic AMP-dependent transcriptional regulator
MPESLESEEGIQMTASESIRFDAADFLAKAGLGRRIVNLKPKEVFFSQGSPADSVFYLQKGRAKITVVSERGKEATITLLSAGDFIGEESIAGAVGLRLSAATAITACTALKSIHPGKRTVDSASAARIGYSACLAA